jgi:glycosyltransferase involved in cell wall biosynthesis
MHAGPPSGRRFVRGVVGALGEADPGIDLVLYTADARSDGPPTARRRRLPRWPGPIFNGIAIQAAIGRDVESVLYQSFTPPWSRAARAVVIHDLIYLTRPEFFTPTERAYFSWIPRLLPHAEVVSTVSGHVREAVLEAFPARDPETVSIIPNGVDDRFFIPPAARAEAAIRARRALALTRPFVLFVGRVNPRKNLARLVAAMLAGGLTELDLVLAGPADGPSDPDLQRAFDAAPSVRVVRLGPVADEWLPGLYAAAEVACYVSLDEGFGVPPLEAMASGTPSVVSDIPPIREVVGDAATRVDPTRVDAIADGIRAVVDDVAGRATRVARGMDKAEQFRWSRSAAAAITALRLAATVRSTRRLAG